MGWEWSTPGFRLIRAAEKFDFPMVVRLLKFNPTQQINYSIERRSGQTKTYITAALLVGNMVRGEGDRRFYCDIMALLGLIFSALVLI